MVFSVAERKRTRFIAVIAVFRLFKAALLILAGIESLRLMSPAARHSLERLIESIPGVGANQFVSRMLEKLLSMPKSSREIAALVSFGYALLLGIEGVGLWLDRTWAEYLSIVVTLSFIPFEVHELMKKTTALRIGVLILNVIIVIYLVRRRWQARHEKGSDAGG